LRVVLHAIATGVAMECDGFRIAVLPTCTQARRGTGRHLFVSVGLGTSILPVRFRAPPEISTS
jgi:predicted MPP superfamily phosphohydrolase